MAVREGVAVVVEIHEGGQRVRVWMAHPGTVLPDHATFPLRNGEAFAHVLEIGGPWRLTLAHGEAPRVVLVDAVVRSLGAILETLEKAG